MRRHQIPNTEIPHTDIRLEHIATYTVHLTVDCCDMAHKCIEALKERQKVQLSAACLYSHQESVTTPSGTTCCSVLHSPHGILAPVSDR
jgi:hypothetical protein